MTCVFCERVKNGEYIDTEFADVVRFEPLNPVTPGHMLFIPKTHREHQAETAVARCMAMAEVYGGIQGEDFNLIISSGEFASQTISHIHVHFVTRREGDGLHLPWTGQLDNN